MSNDLCQGAEPAANGEPRTSLAPPFRAPLAREPGSPIVDFEINYCPPESSTELPAVRGYEVVAELGRGGMGVVYLARQRSLKRLVALKMIAAGMHADPEARWRFRTEAEAAARLQHPNVVQVYEVGEHDGRPFLALE